MKNKPQSFDRQDEPFTLTDRERELLTGMLDQQLYHAARCDRIDNKPMAMRQKAWDLERVALLRKILATGKTKPD